MVPGMTPLNESTTCRDDQSGLPTGRTGALKVRAFDSAAIGMALLDMQGHWIDVNDRFCRMLGFERGELLCRSYQSLTAPEDLDISAWHMHRLQSGRAPVCEFEKRYRCRDGELIWVRIHASISADDAPGGERFIITQAWDITEARRTRLALAESEARLSLALDGAELGMWHWEIGAGHFDFDERARRILGYHRNEVSPTARSVMALCHRDDRRRVIETMERHRAGALQTFETTLRLGQRGGGFVWVLARARVTGRDSDDQPLRVSGTIMDVSEWKKLEDRLTRLATTDQLTGLLNRRSGIEVLAEAVARDRDHDLGLSMVMLDIDHFKTINDNLGHEAGDRVLAEIGRLLRADKRDSDHAIRWGGEEFAVVLSDTRAGGARAQAERLYAAIDQVAASVPDIESISASFGVVTRRAGEDGSALMRRADKLMYQAKQAGRGQIITDT